MTLVETQLPWWSTGMRELGKPAGQPAGRVEMQARLGSLTPRERHVLELLIGGLRGKEIGARLGISLKTVDAHRASILRKMGARNLAQLGWQVAVSGVMGESLPADFGNG